MDQVDHIPEGVPTGGNVSNVRNDLLGAGYTLARQESCSRCGRKLDIFASPDGGGEREFNSMDDPISPGGLHQLTCREKLPDTTLPPVPDQWAKIEQLVGHPVERPKE